MKKLAMIVVIAFALISGFSSTDVYAAGSKSSGNNHYCKSSGNNYYYKSSGNNYKKKKKRHRNNNPRPATKCK